MPGASTSAKKNTGKRVCDELTVQKFNNTATNIAGTATNVHVALKEIEQDLKKDAQGAKEFEDMLLVAEKKKKELQKRIDTNKAWIANFEKNNTSGAFEQQYKTLLSQIEVIYKGAKEFHGKGIEMLIKEFNYHLAYKRWNDTFTAVPFKPK